MRFTTVVSSDVRLGVSSAEKLNMLRKNAIPFDVMKISVVPPTMNEARNVKSLCHRLREVRQAYKQIFEAIFVLNNTNDGTEKVLEDISKQDDYQFVKITASKGARGSAIRHGAEISQGNVIVVMDSDGQYDPAEIHKLVQPIVEEGYSIVVARNHGWANFPRRLTSEAFKKLTKMLLHLDYVQTGFKAGTRQAMLDTIPEDVPGLDIDVRWMNNVIQKGYGNTLCNDVQVKLYPRLHGRTTFTPLKLSLGLLYTTISLAVHRRTGKELPFPESLKRLTLQPNKKPT